MNIKLNNMKFPRNFNLIFASVILLAVGLGCSGNFQCRKTRNALDRSAKCFGQTNNERFYPRC
jgi:hypothetical protein